MVPNHPTHDPDIQHLPFFAISKNFLNNLYSSYYRRIMFFDAFAASILQFQHILYYIIMSLARFNLYANSYAFLCKRAFESKNARGGKWTFYLEIAGIALFWTWYTALLVHIGNWKGILGFVLVSHMVPSPLHIQVNSLSLKAKTGFLNMIVDCSVTFCTLYARSWPIGVIRSSPTPNNHRRYMPRLSRVPPRRPSPSSNTSSVPSPAKAQSPQGKLAGEGVHN